MGARQDSLIRLFQEGGYTCRLKVMPRITRQDIALAGMLEDTDSVYRALGGRLPHFPLRVGSWDVMVNGIPVELDEERHFNRYRAITLASRLYETIAGLDAGLYMRLCREKEPDCLRAAGWRGNWTNPSCEKQFGPGDPERVLGKNGAPRWKQRAFYDFLKDATCLNPSQPVVRFSIWEQLDVGGQVRSLDELLKGYAPGGWWDEVVSRFKERARLR